MRVRETHLPGVGTRYNLAFEHGGEFVIVIHNDGPRHTYWKTSDDADSEPLFELADSEARKVAEIFDGTYFHPIGEDLDEALEGARIKWIHLPEESSLAGQSIDDAQIRTRTGVSIIAIQRGEQTVSNPRRDERLLGGDVIVAVGTDEQHAAFSELLA